MPTIAPQIGATTAIIAMPSLPGKTIRRQTDLCRAAGVEPRTLPALHDLIGGRVRVEQLRHIDIEDLLRREPIQTDLEAVSALLTGRRILVTGAGGSIGSELCRQILRFRPRELILLGHGENSIFVIQRELLRMAREMGSASAQPTIMTAVIADVRFAERVNHVFEQHRPEIVFHAGAHKHVPLMEQHPTEAILTNVCGTENVLAAARRSGVERFVFISTDKAVNPTSVMGASKRAAELLVLRAARETSKPFVVVRFGNVLGSRGSVVLTMKDQIARGGPVTVTHPEMVRFFMTIPEAVQLVLQAAVIGTGGEVFTFDMGDPVRILDLAHDLIRLSGLREGEDIDIEIIGTRPGEKLYEELFLKSETYRRTSHDKIFTTAYAATNSVPDLDARLQALKQAASTGDGLAVRDRLRALVPQYQPSTDSGPPVLREQVGRRYGDATGQDRRSAPRPGLSPASGDGTT